MGKLNTSLISGFDTMSAEEKLKALLELDIPDEVDMSKYVEGSKYDKLKAANDKTSSEFAALKKQLNDRMTDDEKARADADASRKELEEKYNALLKESTIAKYVSKYVAQGYAPELAQKTAEALFSGDMDTVFSNGEKFREAILKTAKADALRDTPRPGAGEGPDTANKLSDSEQIAVNIGKTNSVANKMSSDIISQYM